MSDRDVLSAERAAMCDSFERFGADAPGARLNVNENFIPHEDLGPGAVARVKDATFGI